MNGVLQVWHIYRQSVAQWATARPAWPAPAVPGSRENFYYIPFLTRWQAEIASQNQCGVHTAANMPFPWPGWPDPNIYLSSLTVLSDETCKG